MTYDEVIEKVAAAWASMDGKRKEFDKGKLEPKYDLTHGYYMGYLAEAKELLKRSGIEHLIQIEKEK